MTPFVQSLLGTGAYASVDALKSIFSKNGIPAKLISGPHFIVREFNAFATRWGFEMVLSSPEYPKGHALIEQHIHELYTTLL